ncbi:MAG TPA: glycoside hydrolase family 47 protein [Burkholderiales bacterium]
MEEILDACRHAWRGYRDYAWGHDELKPLSRAPLDWYGTPLLLTPVDAQDTLFLLGLQEEAAQSKTLILERLSFDLDISVQVFEVNIRLLGGLLAAYQLDGDEAFLTLADDLGRRLLPAFDSPTGMPYRFLNLRSGEKNQPVSNPAEIGTLTLEFGTLGRLTGNQKFFQAAKAAVVSLFERRSSLDLVGSRINVETGEWLDPRSHVGGGIDSYYEYLHKAWRLFGDEEFRAMWQVSITAVHQHVAHGDWYGVVDMNTGERLATRFGALQAFFPGLLALSGDIARAERLMAAIEEFGGLLPESFDFSEMKIHSPGYELRPEVLESAFYLYRATGNERYRAFGAGYFDAIVRATRCDTGFAALADVRSGEKKDRMHSFLLAETFKYAYLLFAPAETLDLEAAILTTEAHPLRAL